MDYYSFCCFHVIGFRLILILAPFIKNTHSYFQQNMHLISFLSDIPIIFITTPNSYFGVPICKQTELWIVTFQKLRYLWMEPYYHTQHHEWLQHDTNATSADTNSSGNHARIQWLYHQRDSLWQNIQFYISSTLFQRS